ncbi:hypothetical protein O3G_MSEX010088 [Manduca sexta]|uniref:Uncharacterized protein n=1 Tax=Manduca sexta TaxID=7130 RepID=A0A921ZG01_MANSE|nr:hypothetical protein O3G_MSEX010088 [Manduca sexta]
MEHRNLHRWKPVNGILKSPGLAPVGPWRKLGRESPRERRVERRNGILLGWAEGQEMFASPHRPQFVVTTERYIHLTVCLELRQISPHAGVRLVWRPGAQ